ncbi:MAG: hypothetical protein LBN42_02835 [Oscillospiraceae bacterium]|jgi:hypothetical protein|nr:hypothetical protein [Oscillospiraceae bacterium]
MKKIVIKHAKRRIIAAVAAIACVFSVTVFCPVNNRFISDAAEYYATVSSQVADNGYTNKIGDTEYSFSSSVKSGETTKNPVTLTIPSNISVFRGASKLLPVKVSGSSGVYEFKDTGGYTLTLKTPQNAAGNIYFSTFGFTIGTANIDDGNTMRMVTLEGGRGTYTTNVKADGVTQTMVTVVSYDLVIRISVDGGAFQAYQSGSFIRKAGKYIVNFYHKNDTSKVADTFGFSLTKTIYAPEDIAYIEALSPVDPEQAKDPNTNPDIVIIDENGDVANDNIYTKYTNGDNIPPFTGFATEPPVIGGDTTEATPDVGGGGNPYFTDGLPVINDNGGISIDDIIDNIIDNEGSNVERQVTLVSVFQPDLNVYKWTFEGLGVAFYSNLGENYGIATNPIGFKMIGNDVTVVSFTKDGKETKFTQSDLDKLNAYNKNGHYELALQTIFNNTTYNAKLSFDIIISDVATTATNPPTTTPITPTPTTPPTGTGGTGGTGTTAPSTGSGSIPNFSDIPDDILSSMLDDGPTDEDNNYEPEFPIIDNGDQKNNFTTEIGKRTGLDQIFDSEKKVFVQSDLSGYEFFTNIPNGIFTNKPVTITMPNEGRPTFKLTRNGQSFEYVPGSQITEDGVYCLTFTALNMSAIINNAPPARFTFRIINVGANTIDYVNAPFGYKISNVSEIVEVQDGYLVSKERKVVLELGKTFVKFDLESLKDNNLSEGKSYSVEFVPDDARMPTYLVDLTADYTAPKIFVENEKNTATVKFDETPKNYSIMLDGRNIEYEDVFKKTGTYIVTASDSAGNTVTVSFEIKYHANLSTILFIVIAIVLVIAAVVFFKNVKKTSKIR